MRSGRLCFAKKSAAKSAMFLTSPSPRTSQKLETSQSADVAYLSFRSSTHPLIPIPAHLHALQQAALTVEVVHVGDWALEVQEKREALERACRLASRHFT